MVRAERLIDEERLHIQVETSQADLPSMRNRLFRYGPLVVWALLIFIGSGNVLSAEHTSVLVRFAKWLFPSVTPASFAWFHFAVRKAGHLTEYAILAALAARAFRNSSHKFISVHWFQFSLLLAVTYALTDEFHQSFVPSRTASIQDSLIDSAGALIALSIIWFRHRRTYNPRRVRIPIDRDSDRIKARAAKY